MTGDPFDDNTGEHDPDRARLSYLSGEDRDVSLDPFDQAELDAMLATLADASTWDDPPPDLGDRIVQLIADEAAAGRTVDRAADTATAPKADAAVKPLSRHRRFAWVGPAVLGAAAASLIVVAVGRIDGDDEDSIAVDATIAVAGTELAPGISGTAEIDVVQSGLRISLQLAGLPRREDKEFYEAWLRSEDGEGLIPIGTFHDGDDVVLWAGVALEDYPIITITREVVAGPQAPEQGSSGEVVARGQLAP